MDRVPDWLRVVLGLITLLGALVGALVRTSRGGPAQSTEDAVLLSYSSRGRMLLAAGAVVLSLMAATPIWPAVMGEVDAIWLVVMGCTMVPTAMLAVHVWRQRDFVVHADATGITVRDPRRGARLLRWTGLNDLNLRTGLLSCRLRAGDLRMRFPGTLPGIPQLLAIVRRNVPAVRWRRWRGEVQTFQEAQRRIGRQPWA